MTETKPAPPANINEFNQIAGLIFARLPAPPSNGGPTSSASPDYLISFTAERAVRFR